MSAVSQIQAVINPEASAQLETGNSLVILNHLTQMKMFGIRQGIELYPEQDNEKDTRKTFIQQVWDYNELDIYQDRIWELALCTGQLLMYYRPNQEGLYTISFFPREDFRVEYNEDNRIELAMIRYWYWESHGVSAARQKKWIRLIITKDRIYQENYGVGMKPSWDIAFGGTNRQEMENSLGFVPCRVIRVNPLGPGQNGVSDFSPLMEHIDNLNDDEDAIKENLQFFGNPILMATRSPNEVLEIASTKSTNLTRAHTITMESGWAAPELGMNSTAKSTPRHLKMGPNLRLKKVVGNIQADERFGFISPPPIASEHKKHVVETREALHFALGGIDEIGIHANATAYEMKVVYGKVATTALKKAKSIYTYGICRAFEDMIVAEEALFRKTMANALKVEPSEMTDGVIQQYLANNGGQIPPGVYGLPPMGKRKVSWRWTGPVFEDSPDDLQRRSIVVRNLQELGVPSIEALKIMFPDKTEAEREGMLAGGYPFRYMNAVAGTTGQMLGLYQQFMALPSQSDPAQPLIAKIPLEPMIEKSAQVLFNELNYARPTDQSSPGESPYITGTNSYNEWLRTVGAYQYGLAAAAGIPVTQPPGVSGDGVQQPASTGTILPGTSGNTGNPGYLDSPAANGAGIQPTFTGGSTTGLQQQLGGTAGSGAGGAGQFVPIPPEYVVGLPQPGATIGRTAERLPKRKTGTELYAEYQQRLAAELSANRPSTKPRSKAKGRSKSTKSGSTK